jgi:hypothetical protein
MNYILPVQCGAVDMAKEYNFITKTQIENKENKENKKNLQDKNKSNLNSYLAGLFEGDGHIQISRGKKSIRKFVVGITFNIKDLPLCEHLKNLICHGARIRIKQENNACDLLIGNHKNLIRFVELVNGYLRTPKIYKFNQLIDYLNCKYNLHFYKYEIDSSDFASNNWLAGFIDADGGFYVRYSNPMRYLTKDKPKNKFRIACSLTIEQRIIDPASGLSYEDLFIKLSKFFKCKLVISTHNTNKNYFKINAYNQTSLKIILNYFDNFSLYSSKYLDYKDWSEVAKALLDKTAYLPITKLEILSHKNNMNTNRTYFNWYHLKSLIK